MYTTLIQTLWQHKLAKISLLLALNQFCLHCFLEDHNINSALKKELLETRIDKRFFSKVILKNPEGEGVRDDPISIERVVLLPIENWSPDFINPTSNCVKGAS